MCKPCIDKLRRQKATEFAQSIVIEQKHDFKVGDYIQYVGSSPTIKKYTSSATRKGYRFSNKHLSKRKIGLSAHEVHPADVAGLLNRVINSRHIFQIVPSNPAISEVPKPEAPLTVEPAKPTSIDKEIPEVVEALEVDVPILEVDTLDLERASQISLADLTVKKATEVWEGLTDLEKDLYREVLLQEEKQSKNRKTIIKLLS